MDFFEPPSDGWTNYERIILRDVLISVYSAIPNSLDKFIFLAYLEGEYKQVDIARMIGVSQAAISKRIKKIVQEMRRLKKKQRL